MTDNKILTLSILVFSIIILITMIYRLSKKNNQNKLYHYFKLLGVVLTIHSVGLVLQIIFSSISSIPAIYFDYIAYTGGVFTPVIFTVIALLYANPNFNVKKTKYLYIIPIISLLVLWTNDFHGLFYKAYSIDLDKTVPGIYMNINIIYSYSLMIIAFIMLIRSSIMKSGFFSIQTGLIVVGSFIPIFANFLGTLNVIAMNIYVTPVLFIVTSICLSIAIFKYKALNITPIAFRTVIDTMSDAFVAISKDGTISDTNLTFRKLFANVIEASPEDNLFDIIEKTNIYDINSIKKSINDAHELKKIVTNEYHMVKGEFDKYFEVDFHPIKAKRDNYYIGTLLLFKDITQHKKDMSAIEEKQDIIVKQQQLVSIGELAGGVAHDINTPISAIKTGIVMLTQTSEGRTDGEKEILYRMDNCASKIITIVNSMRNQIRNLGSDTQIQFKISDVLNDINIITYHELAKSKSKIIIDIKSDISIHGDPTKLSQVITNFVVNASQAYAKNEGGKIEIIVDKNEEGEAVIVIKDTAGGIDSKIAPFIFKNILTTKGTSGTGLGLYLAYSVIKGNFNGEISFETKEGIGTTFIITIPIKKD